MSLSCPKISSCYPSVGPGPYSLCHSLASHPMPLQQLAKKTKLSVGTVKFYIHKFSCFKLVGYGKPIPEVPFVSLITRKRSLHSRHLLDNSASDSSLFTVYILCSSGRYDRSNSGRGDLCNIPLVFISKASWSCLSLRLLGCKRLSLM
jgi:hypothetical protein